MIKLLATDLDGTLFYPKRRFTLLEKSNVKFLKDFSNAGGKIVLVTGRDRRMSMKVKKKLGIDLAVLGCNGAFIYEDNKFVQSSPIPKDILFDVYMNMKVNYNILGFFLFDEDDTIKISVVKKTSIIPYLGIFMNFFNFAYAEKYIVSEEKVLSSIANGHVYKLMPIFDLGQKGKIQADEVSYVLKEHYKDKLTINSASFTLEITNKNTNKANALLEYIKMNGISKEEVIVVGDSNNDLPLFNNFPNSFGMNNGLEHVISKARFRIDKVSDIRDYIFTNDNKLADILQNKK